MSNKRLVENQSVQEKELQAKETRLHMGHFAFMRAVVQGLDTRQNWDRYLRLEGEHDDIRNVRRTIQWIRDEFAAAAKRNAKHGTARLIQIDANRINDKAARLPSLEEFALEHGLEDFSQTEQLEYYLARHGSAPASQSRRRRLVLRQLEALRWLEDLAAQPPNPQDSVNSWLNPDLATRLEAVGIVTLEQLILRINGVGLRWWASIPGIGAGKAERIVSWLRAQERELGMRIGEHVNRTRSSLTDDELNRVVQAGTAVVPLEKLVTPPGLDGATGDFRAPRGLCRIDADKDIDAVLAWVKSKAEKPDCAEARLSNTQRAYLKEGERFLLWAVIQREKAMSSLTAEDCMAYLVFLENPSPSEQWCGKRGREKWSPLWRPFEGPLSATARRHAVVILKNLFRFLVDTGYLGSNAWEDIVLPSPKQARQVTRFSTAHWFLIEKKLAALPETSANLRLALAIALIRKTGMRLSQLVAARVNDLVYSERLEASISKHHAQLLVLERGGRQRAVRIDETVLLRLSHYLEKRGLHPVPGHPENRDAYLLGAATDIEERAPWTAKQNRRIDPKAGIAPGTLYDQLKSFFHLCAIDTVAHDPDQGHVFESATTKWLSEVD